MNVWCDMDVCVFNFVQIMIRVKDAELQKLRSQVKNLENSLHRTTEVSPHHTTVVSPCHTTEVSPHHTTVVSPCHTTVVSPCHTTVVKSLSHHSGESLSHHRGKSPSHHTGKSPSRHSGKSPSHHSVKSLSHHQVSPLPPSPHSHPLPAVVKEHGVGCVWTVATSQSAVENEVWWERQKDMILVTASCGIYDTCNTQLWDL